ncbi:Deproteinrin unc-8 [Bulinus truncatus]|nr:Deproteinrin unc-8 [Bulinus truncatus]
MNCPRRDFITDLKHVLHSFAEKTSLNGIPFIKSSTSFFVKLLWSLLLAAAIGFLFFHLYNLFSNYFDYNKFSQINLSYKSLQFPAVTVCNVNIMRLSQVNKSSEQLRNFLSSLNLQTADKKLESQLPTKYDDSIDTDDYTTYVPIPDEDYDDDNSWDWNFTDYTSERAVIVTIAAQKLQMITKFRRRSKTFSLLTPSTAPWATKLKTCWSAAHFLDAFAVLSLELVLFLESHEYMTNVTSSRGAIVSIHDQNTVTFPGTEGLALYPGTNTLIGLKKVINSL